MIPNKSTYSPLYKKPTLVRGLGVGSCCLLPVACCLLPTPYSLLPTPYSQGRRTSPN
ncbi:MAG: hypothetical protein F6K55_20010 [Moorea sp. SIO4A3]|nr:hypothetical protein [Moorena sp. SIO4A3]